MTKPTKWHVCPAKTQISLGTQPVWSESSLSTWRKLWSSLSSQQRLIRLGRCPGWSEFSLGAQSFCWVCHVIFGGFQCWKWVVAKCDQKCAAATKFPPKSGPENLFGRPHIGQEYCIFSVYLLSISEINLVKTAQRTSDNKNQKMHKNASVCSKLNCWISRVSCNL